MGNSILAGTLSFNPILPPLVLAQEKPSSPPAQPSPASGPVAFGVGGYRLTTGFLALATITFCRGHKKRSEVMRETLKAINTSLTRMEI